MPQEGGGRRERTALDASVAADEQPPSDGVVDEDEVAEVASDLGMTFVAAKQRLSARLKDPGRQ